MPDCEKRVKLHKEKRPIFSRFQLEEQIDQIYEKRVPLPSGGSLIIEPTEALVSIDVNSGKSSGERGIEDTAFKANMEAAEEVARQLRLRDLGGLIVIDFIDMRENKHNSDVEKTLKNALKMDKARVNVGRISQFGIMEMSRQRIAKTLNDAIYLECPHCEGRGKVKSVEAMAVSFLRKVHAAAAKGTVGEVRGGLPLEVAYYLLNRKKRELTQIENDYEIEVTVKGKTSFLLNQLELEIVKRDKPHLDDVLKSEAEAEEAHKTVIPHAAPTPHSGAEEELKAETGAPAEGGKKRKRRKKKKKSATDLPLDTIDTDQVDGDTELNDASLLEDVPETGEVSSPDGEESAVDSTLKPKKRKRKKKKPAADLALDTTDAGRVDGDTELDDASSELDAPETGDASAPESEESPGEAAQKPKKRTRRRSRSKAHKGSEHPGEEHSDAPVSEPLASESPAAEAPMLAAAPEQPAAEVKPKRVRTPRTKKEDATAAAPVAPEPAAETVAPPESPPAARKTRKAAVKKSMTADITPEPEVVPKKAAARPRQKKTVEER
jgi:ribonuclease E